MKVYRNPLWSMATPPSKSVSRGRTFVSILEGGHSSSQAFDSKVLEYLACRKLHFRQECEPL